MSGFRRGCTGCVNIGRYVSITGNLSTLGLVVHKCGRVKVVRRNSRVVIPTGACVTAVLTVASGNLVPILIRPACRRLRVSMSGVRRHVAPGAGKVVVMRLCNHVTCGRGLNRVYGGRGLGLVRSYTRDRKYI